MRPYTRLLVCISLGAIVALMACATKNSSGGFVTGSSSGDLGNSNTSTQQTGTTFNQNAGGAQAVLAGTGQSVAIVQEALIGGTGPRTNQALAGTPSGLVLAAAALGLTGGTTLQGPGTAQLGGSSLQSFSSGGTTLEHNGGLINTFTDGLIAWGRWTYNPNVAVETNSFFKTTTNGTTTLSPVTGGALHYVIGAPTPVANLPASGTVRYNLLGTTFPTTNTTNNFQQNENRMLSGGLAVLWGGAGTKIGVDFLLDINAGTTHYSYRGLSSGGLDNPGLSEVGLIAGTSTFAGTILATTNQPGACVGPRSSNCSAKVNGLFVGNNAERAGLTYAIIDPGSSAPVVYGAATFTAGASTPGSTPGSTPTPGTPAVTLLSQTNPVTVSVAGGPDIPSFFPNNTGSVTQNPDLSLSALNYSAGILALTRGTTASADVGGDQFITWGRWTAGTAAGNQFGSAPSALPGNASLHYIAGIPTPAAALPLTGTATFNLLGATSPTFGNGVGGPGSVTAATMAVAWGGSATTKVGLDMTVLMPGDSSYRILTAGGLATPGSSQIAINGGSATFTGSVGMPATGRACSGGGCTADVNGLFAGSAAERAALTYSISNGVSANGIFGAAAFKR